MARRRGVNFRNLKVGVRHRDDHDRSMLVRQLARLGAEVVFQEEAPDAAALRSVEALFFDGDAGPPVGRTSKAAWPDIPLVALIGSEAPSRLEWVLAQEVSAYLLKPVRPTGVLTALAVACREFERRRGLSNEIARLEEKLRCRRFVFSAQLALMRAHDLGEAEAFARLRRLAMERHTTIEVVSIGLLNGTLSSAGRTLASGARDR